MNRTLGIVALIMILILLAGVGGLLWRSGTDPKMEMVGVTRAEFLQAYNDDIQGFYCSADKSGPCQIEDAELIEVFVEQTLYIAKFSPSDRVNFVYGCRPVISLPGLP